MLVGVFAERMIKSSKPPNGTHEYALLRQSNANGTEVHFYEFSTTELLCNQTSQNSR